MNKNIAQLMGKIHFLKHIVINKRSNNVNIRSSQYSLLSYLSRNDGCTQSEIAEFLIVTPASVAMSIKKLEKEGYITRKIDKENMRCKRVFLTEKGMEVIKNNKEVFTKIDSEMFAGFNESELEQLGGYIERIYYNISNLEEVNSISKLPIPILISIINENSKGGKCDDKKD